MVSVRRTLHNSTALTSASLALLLITSAASANPLDGQVVAGDATITTPDPSTLVINQHSQNVVLNWGSFDIDAGETTTFVQPNIDAWALNRVIGSQDPSVIAGTLNANGNIAIVNPDGVVFSHGSRVDVGGLVATTADIDNDAFMRGELSFNLPGNPAAAVINEGTVSVRDHGLAAFVAPGVRNSGVITARFGTVSLASGNTFALDLYGDGLVSLAIGDEITEEVIDVATGLPMADLVKNEGTISANGGTVALTAATARTAVNSVINNTGVIEANSVGMRDGKIILGAQTATSRPAAAPPQTVRVSGTLRTTAVTSSLRPTARPGTIEITGEDIQIAGATIDASGTNGGGTILIGGDYLGGQEISDLFPVGEEFREDYDVATATNVTVDNATTIDASATENGDGGKIILWSDVATTTSAEILAFGAGDGTGGFIETSSAGTLSLPEGYVSAGQGGMWLLDPRYITIGTTDSEIGESQFVSASTISASLNAGNAGTNVQLVATGENAELAVYSDILKTEGGDAQLLLGSTGSVLIAADIISTSGELDVGIVTADVYDDYDDEAGQFLAVPSGRFQLNGGNTINTNGGQFGFKGAQFQAVDATEFIIGEDPVIVPPGRIVTEGGNITFGLSPNSVSGAGYAGFFGCDSGTSSCGVGSRFVLDAGSGRVGFALNTNYTPTGTDDLPVVYVGDLGIRTTGELIINNVVLKSNRPTNRNGVHNVEFGALTLQNDGEMDFPFADVPGLEAALNEAPQPVAGVNLNDFQFTVGESVTYVLPQLFTDDGAPGTWRVESVSLPAGIRFERLGAELYGLSGTFEGAPGTYQIVLRAIDEHGATSEITLSVTFDAPVITPPVDTPPIAFPGTVSLPNAEVGTAYKQTTRVLFSDDQAVSDLTLITSGLPAGLTATANNDGTVTISGTPTTSGAVAFSVTATDAGGNITAISVNLTIGAAPPPPPPVNEAPMANVTTLQPVQLEEDQRWEYTSAPGVFSDDGGAENLTLTFTGLQTRPTGGGVLRIERRVNADGSFTIIVPAGYILAGSQNITFTVSDGEQTATTSLTLTVTAEPVTPEPPTTPDTGVENGTAGQSVDNPEASEDEFRVLAIQRQPDDAISVAFAATSEQGETISESFSQNLIAQLGDNWPSFVTDQFLAQLLDYSFNGTKQLTDTLSLAQFLARNPDQYRELLIRNLTAANAKAVARTSATAFAGVFVQAVFDTSADMVFEQSAGNPRDVWNRYAIRRTGLVASSAISSSGNGFAFGVNIFIGEYRYINSDLRQTFELMSETRRLNDETEFTEALVDMRVASNLSDSNTIGQYSPDIAILSRNAKDQLQNRFGREGGATLHNLIEKAQLVRELSKDGMSQEDNVALSALVREAVQLPEEINFFGDKILEAFEIKKIINGG